MTSKETKKNAVETDVYRPQLWDVVGAEKFLQVQGYTYYGCLYAQGTNDDLTMKVTGSTRRTRGRGTGAGMSI